jgi:DNA-binding beta-propeller fold protein YncE
MRKYGFIAAAALGAAALVFAGKAVDVSALLASAARVGKQPGSNFSLMVTQQLIRPWGEQTPVPGRPVDMAIDRERALIAVLNMSSVNLLDLRTNTSRGEFKTHPTSYAGIAFRPMTAEVWASEAAVNGNASIFIGKLDSLGKPAGSERIALPAQSIPAGIAFSTDGSRAWVAMNGRAVVAEISAADHKVSREIPVGLAPFSVLLSQKGDRLYVSNRGGHPPTSGQTQAFSNGTAFATDPETGAVRAGTVSVIDLSTGKASEAAVGMAPSGMALSADGTLLAVTNGHSDTISLLDTATLRTKTISLPAWPDGLLGSQPVAAAFSPQGDRLYVASAGSNSLAVYSKRDQSWAFSGSMPTGWFPDSVQLDPEGNLCVLNVKGLGNTEDGNGGHRSPSFEGSLSRIPAPSAAQLAAGTREVRAANYPKFSPAGGVDNLRSLGIHHVILLVKENRTYDQVFGDMPKGNSDPKFLMYGKEVTPNHHALANQYVLLDNFYASGAISFDGHQWLEQGFVSDNVERALRSSPRGYAWNLADALDVSPAGFFWQHSPRPINVRIGGVLSLPTEFNSATGTVRDITENQIRPWKEYWDSYKRGDWRSAVGSRAAVPALASVIDRRYPVNSMRVPDQIRASIFETEIQEAEKSGQLPDLMVFGMTSDHTMGTSPDSPTPRAMVADNDLALGRMIEAISKSRFWPETLVLVVEDDAQNGVDHVDGHRTVALAIGPSVRRAAVDSSFYTHLSMARTIQEILHIPPRTQFLKSARPMHSVFTATRDLTPYTAIQPGIALDTMNPPLHSLADNQRWAAQWSAARNWNHVDDVPEQTLNRILWWDAHGYGTKPPVSSSSHK